MLEVLVLIFALAGLWVSLYINYKESKNEQMICRFGEKCNDVLQSKYNRTFGIKNEKLGILYYLLIAVLATLVLLGTTSLFSIPLTTALFILAIPAFFFSAFLVIIQLFVLKAWCEYCMLSATASLGIFITELFIFF